jgi:HPt (histidine-containing phosphotransfer) domain-containing protein
MVVFDPALVEEAFGAFDASAHDLLSLFLSRMEVMIARIRDTIDRADFADAREATHSARSAASFVGGAELAAILGQMEQALVDARYDDAVSCIAEIVAAWERLRAAVRGRLGQ